MSTYYVSAASGSDVNSGLSEALAWATVDKGMNTVAAGDKVWVKADGNYAELATIDTVGTETAPIVFEGYTTTKGDGGRATITGSSARANCVADSIAVNTAIYYVFKNFRFTGAIADGVNTDCNHLTFKNCKFDTNGVNGITARLSLYEACEFSSNTERGAQIAAALSIFIACKFYNNGTDGAFSNNVLVCVGCTFFSNADSGIFVGTHGVIINCTVDGDAKDTTIGLSAYEPTSLLAVVNNVFYDCATGFNGAAGRGDRVVSRNNCVNGNTTAYSNAETFTGEVTSAPQFTNEVGGADYTPAAGSPLINAGLNG